MILFRNKTTSTLLLLELKREQLKRKELLFPLLLNGFTGYASQSDAEIDAELNKLISETSHKIRLKIVRFTRSPEILSALVADASENVCRAIAVNPAATAAILAQLSNSRSTHVLTGVCSNPITPGHILNLFKDSSRLKRYVAANAATPPETLEEMATKASWRTPEIAEIARNPSTPTKTLEDFCRSENTEIQAITAQNQALTEDLMWILAAKRMPTIRWHLAHNPALIPAVLEALSKDKDISVREAVAENAATPSHVLGLMGKDRIKAVQRALSLNTNTPSEALKLLTRNNDLDTARFARTNLRRKGIASCPASPP